ncbi:hypothetical protein GE09DRAFT_1075605 [Coniochaeta sp. 2T2.1]|nr:hypothetical protein GE09DRAFT_1075605 [Coniochaeta sp. 2T2.1]
MDKILRRVRMAERQVVRRRKALAKTKFINETKPDFTREVELSLQGVKKDLKDARVARRHAWDMGPIAPRQEVPRVADGTPNEIAQWGTVNTSRAMSQMNLHPKLLEERCAWAGGSQFLCLAAGDRVVVTEGSLKGTVDKISKIALENGMLALENSSTNVTLPRWFTSQSGYVANVPYRLPISAVRLVHPITDEETGVTKDVIIKQLKPIRIIPDRPTRTVTWSRMVPGLNVTIPWPKAEKPTFEDSKCDTLRIHMEERTFIPTLLSPPMPSEVINELRNQYSKFRTRHTEEYIAKKAAEEEEKRAIREQAREMLTPVQEFNRAQREIRRARGQPVLTEEMLAKIGEVMAKNLNARGERTVPLIPAETVKAPDAAPSS